MLSSLISFPRWRSFWVSVNTFAISSRIAKPLLFQFLRHNSVPRIDCDIKGIRPCVGHIPERFLNEHRRHAANAKLQKQDFFVHILFQERIELAVFFPIFPALKKYPGTHPRLHFRATLRAAGNQLRGNSQIRINKVVQLMKRFHGIVKLIMTPAATLEIPPVALDGADLFFREYTGKLRVLISRQDVVVLVLRISNRSL